MGHFSVVVGVWVGVLLLKTAPIPRKLLWRVQPHSDALIETVEMHEPPQGRHDVVVADVEASRHLGEPGRRLCGCILAAINTSDIGATRGTGCHLEDNDARIARWARQLLHQGAHVAGDGDGNALGRLLPQVQCHYGLERVHL